MFPLLLVIATNFPFVVHSGNNRNFHLSAFQAIKIYITGYPNQIGTVGTIYIIPRYLLSITTYIEFNYILHPEVCPLSPLPV